VNQRVYGAIRIVLLLSLTTLLLTPGLMSSPALANQETRRVTASALFSHPFNVRLDGHERGRDRPGPQDDFDGVEWNERRDHWGWDGPRQVVRLFNRTDGRLRMRGKVELNTIRGDDVTPFNLAEARATCVECQTFSIALQLNVYEREAQTLLPENRGVAENEHCTGCVTVARAVQYVIPADEPNHVPDRAESLIRELERELRRIHSESNRISAAEANDRIQKVLDQFNDLGQSMLSAAAVQTDENGEDDSEVSPGPKTVPGDVPPSAAATPTATPGGAELTATPTLEPTVTSTPEPTPMP
jgi:hypothetical protein